MAGKRRFELPTPLTPSGLRTFHALFYAELRTTIFSRIDAALQEGELMLIYAIFHLGSSQKSPKLS